MQLRVSVEREPRNPEYFFFFFPSFSGSSCLLRAHSPVWVSQAQDKSFPILKLFRLLSWNGYTGMWLLNFKIQLPLPGKDCLVFIPSPRQISTPNPHSRPWGGKERRGKEEPLGRQAGGQCGVDLGSAGRGTQAGAGNGRAASAPRARRPAGGGRAAGRPPRGPPGWRVARRGECWGPPTVRGGRQRLCNPQPPRPPSPPACLPPCLRSAGARISLVLSLPCVFHTGSARPSVTCCRVPGWRSEAPAASRRSQLSEPASSQSPERRAPWGCRVAAWSRCEAGSWARGLGAGLSLSRSAAPCCSLTRVHFLHCAPLAACFLGGSLQTLWLCCRRGAMDTGVNARGSTRRPGTCPASSPTHSRRELSRQDWLCLGGFLSPQLPSPPLPVFLLLPEAAALCSSLCSLGRGL